MKKIKFLLFLFVFSTILTACSKDDLTDKDGVFAMENLPKKFSADIPDSIVGNGDSARMIHKNILRAVGDQSQGCSTVKEMTGMMKEFSTMIPLYAVMADAAISQNSLSPDGSTHDCSIKYTREMLDAITEIMGDDVMGDMSELEQMIGVSESVTIVYSNTASAPYKYSVIITMMDSTTTMYWSEDKTKTKIELPIFLEMSPEGDKLKSTPSEDGRIEFVYDDSAKSMNLLFSYTGMEMNMSLQEEGDGALFTMNNKYGGSVYLMEGYADDNGGYIKTKITDSSFGTTSFSESFDANGIVTEDTGSYADMYASGSTVVDDLQGDLGFIKDESGAADGEYLITANSSFSTSDIVGYGIVKDGRLVIQDIGGANYSSAAAGNTVYLFSVTYDDASGESTIATSSTPVAL